MEKMFKFFIISLGVITLFAACSSSTNSDQDNNEFIATLDDFKGYTSWTQVASNIGPDPLLMTAHGANDTLTRNVYFNEEARLQDGAYPSGSIIIKELRDDQNMLQGGITIMVKRNGGFNEEGNGWEWFMTDTNLESILVQGDNASAMDGACAGCHAQANTNNNGADWVFSKR